MMLASLAGAGWKTVGSVAYLAYLATLVGYGLWSHLMRLYPAATVAPLTLLVPIVAMTASALILDESMQGWKLIGAALVMIGLCINMFGPRLTPNVTRPPAPPARSGEASRRC
ncbi:MAG: EamA family transporter [Lautropia sp.]|nr:EamA family transporter [Lautropia sp.]